MNFFLHFLIVFLITGSSVILGMLIAWNVFEKRFKKIYPQVVKDAIESLYKIKKDPDLTVYTKQKKKD